MWICVMLQNKNKMCFASLQCVWLHLKEPLSSHSMFAPINRHEAELIQQQAPPSYGQLIAQGIIPPVEDFPIENPNEVREQSARDF